MAEFIYTMVRARKAVGEKLILDDVTMSFFPGAKIGMVGPNGASFPMIFVKGVLIGGSSDMRTLIENDEFKKLLD